MTTAYLLLVYYFCYRRNKMSNAGPSKNRTKIGFTFFVSAKSGYELFERKKEQFFSTQKQIKRTQSKFGVG
jgi:hypothetical protein